MLIEITEVSRTYRRGQQLAQAVDTATLTLENENLVASPEHPVPGKSPCCT